MVLTLKLGFPAVRARRIRSKGSLRGLTAETTLNIEQFVLPLFVNERAQHSEPIDSMPGVQRYSLNTLVEGVSAAVDNGLKAFLLFGIPSEKDESASGAYAENGVVQKSINQLVHAFGDRITILADTCLCEYTSHGHCGVVKDGKVDNDESLRLLAKTAVSQAAAGAHIVSPSAMMDGQVKAIREALDDAGQKDTLIMSYSAKYASCFYGPFRTAADSKPQFGDRKTYQMDPRNRREALKEVELDAQEGADIVMVKPAMPYLDVLSSVRSEFNLPLAAYQVSGEYSMIKAASSLGYLDEKSAVFESLYSIRRAGADIIISYYADRLAAWLNE
jgi:porphobilinogen synthase